MWRSRVSFLGFPRLSKQWRFFLLQWLLFSYDLILLFCVYLIVSGRSWFPENESISIFFKWCHFETALGSFRNGYGDGNENSRKAAKQQLCACSTLFGAFGCHCFTNTTWKFLVLRCMKDEWTWENDFLFSLPEQWYSWLSHFEFNTRKIRQCFSIWTRWSIRAKKFEAARIHFLCGQFRCHRCCRCLSSLFHRRKDFVSY